MNKLIKLSFLAGFLFLSTNILAKDKDFSVAIKEVRNKTVNFELSNAKNVSIYVYNGERGEIFSEKIISNDSVEKAYNMSDMTAGTYYLVAESESKIEKYKITVDEKNVIVDQAPVSAITKPEYTINKNIVKLQMANVIGDVRVSIYDTLNNTYYSKNNVTKDGNLDLTFDLNPANADTYIINVEKDGDSFSRMITLK
ncbi:DUF3244 domain-containing protein [Epilithonimonas xixisoli]|uniref:Uncharacterized protein DUF3244 n=1 Tax=Epilithonimonas xixisoli TaxID=1476462 RepID=A0A4R8IK70_9FLAO|nr:DUF3244 domain-containing protein [Epilithonimonas xixisoli]TDX87039.1 uncharacterized protein DUF3244 [Epilithonimonas xixisoli]